MRSTSQSASCAPLWAILPRIPRSLRRCRAAATVLSPPSRARRSRLPRQCRLVWRTLVAIENPGTNSRAGRLLWISLAVLICAALVGAGVWLGRRSVSSRPPEVQRLTVSRGTVYSARFAPDGRNVFYAASWEGSPVEIFSTDLKFHGSRSLGLSGTDLLAISSSGQMAVLQPAEPKFMTGMKGTLGQVPLTGGTPRQIAENVEWADWSPDGKTLAVVHDVAGKQRLEYPLGHVLYETSGWISHMRVSPNGRQIAFLDHPTLDDDQGGVSIVDLDGRRTVLSAGWECEEGLAWSPEREGSVVFGHASRIAAPDLCRRFVGPCAPRLPRIWAG